MPHGPGSTSAKNLPFMLSVSDHSGLPRQPSGQDSTPEPFASMLRDPTKVQIGSGRCRIPPIEQAFSRTFEQPADALSQRRFACNRRAFACSDRMIEPPPRGRLGSSSRSGAPGQLVGAARDGQVTEQALHAGNVPSAECGWSPPSFAGAQPPGDNLLGQAVRRVQGSLRIRRPDRDSPMQVRRGYRRASA